MKSKVKKNIQLILKLLVAFGVLALVMSKLDMHEVLHTLRSFGWPSIVGSLMVVTVAHVITAERMRFFLKTIRMPIPRGYALKLYYVGTLFNLALPTGVGGDAVKAWALRRTYDSPLKPIIKALILDRASGLFVLCIIGPVLFLLLKVDLPYFDWLAAAALPVATACYFVLAKMLFGQRVRDGILGCGYSFVSQGLWCAIIIIYYFASGDQGGMITYVLLYAAGSIVSLLPVTVGGLGLREATFSYGAIWLKAHAGVQADPERAVAVSLALFMLYIVSSLPGALWAGQIWPKKEHIIQD
jgi:uncharacterized membrane protein YbhN (UPF0104 family)